MLGLKIAGAAELPPYTVIGDGFNVKAPEERVEIRIPDKDRLRHTFIFGTTGVGKTRLAENLIEQDIYKGYSVLYFDPKGDQQIFTKIYDLARKAGRLNELMLVTPVYPEYSAEVDPMAYYFTPDEIVNNVVAGVKTGKEPFYRNIAKEITTAVVLGHLLIAKEEGRLPAVNIDTIRKSIRRAALEEMHQALLRIGSEEAEDVAGMLQDILESPQDYYSKVSSTLRTALSELCFGNIGKIIGKADSNRFIKRIEEGKPVIMVVHTGTMMFREAASTLGKVILSMVQSAIGRAYLSRRQKLEPALSIHIDEAQSLLFDGIEDLFAKGGSANVMVQAYCQSVNQLIAAFDNNTAQARAMLDNANTKIFMRCVDAETSEYVVKHFGTRELLSGVFGHAGVTARSQEKEILRTTDVLDLQPQDIYVMTYSGRYKGITLPASDPDLKINFPDAPAILRIGNPDVEEEE